MCLYRGIRCLHCGHPDFELHQFCHTLLRELQRIDDPCQRNAFLLPFDPPDCRPRPGVNIVGWLVSQRYCGRCLRAFRMGGGEHRRAYGGGGGGGGY